MPIVFLFLAWASISLLVSLLGIRTKNPKIRFSLLALLILWWPILFFTLAQYGFLAGLTLFAFSFLILGLLYFAYQNLRE